MEFCYQRFVRQQGALAVVMAHLHVVKTCIATSPEPTADQVGASVRNAMAAAASQVEDTLQQLACPVFEELPAEIQATCEAASIWPT